MTALMTKCKTRPEWAMDQMFNNFFDMPVMKHGHNFAPAVDIVEHDDDIMMTFQLPGMNKEDISITVENDVLTVAGKRENKVVDENAKYIHREIHYGEFNRTFNLADSVDAESIEANYKNGLLEIKLNKKEEVKPKQIEVNVS